MTAATRAAAGQNGAYPRRLKLKGRRSVQVRPMVEADAEALHRFFLRIPEDDLLFLRRDVTDRSVIAGWAEDISAGRTLTLLAERDGDVVGEASIHRNAFPGRRTLPRFAS